MMMNMLIADNRIQVYNIIFSFFMISFSFCPKDREILLFMFIFVG